MNRKKRCYKIEILKEITAETMEDGIMALKKEFEKYDMVFIKPEKSKRTEKQNNSIHKWLSQWAEVLNENGIDMKMIVKNSVPIPCTMQLLKDNIWRPTQIALFGKESTKDLDSDKEIDMIIDVITKFMGELYQIYIPFPGKETREEGRYEN